MKTSLEQPANEATFSQGVKWSLIAHVFLLLFGCLQGWLFRPKPLNPISSLKVDLVSLPTELQRNIHASQAIPTLSAKAKALGIPANIVPHKQATQHEQSILKHNQRALDRLKALAKIQEETNEPVRGNKISKGTSFSGQAVEAQEANYLDTLKDRIQSHWKLPPWLARQVLSAQVRLLIDAHGNLRSSEITQSSGNAQFDQAVRDTLDLSQPFPKPPADLQLQMMTDGILVGFPL